MKNIKLYFFSMLMVLFASTSISQTVTTTVNWTTGWCSICGNQTGNYACAQGSGSGNWNNGIRTFADPVPNGNIVTNVCVVINKVDCGLSNLCVELNGTQIGACQAPTNGSNCGCGTCWPQTFCDTFPCPVGLPNYVYNGINQIQLLNTGNLCVNSAVITLTYEPCVCNMTATITPTQVTCNGACDGTASANAINGTGPFNYNWSNGGTSQTETGLCPGVYSVTITDDNGCTADTFVTITEPPLLTANITAQNDLLCNGDANGSATVTAGGGTPAYTYAWSSGGTTTTENNLNGGTYTVTVTDQNGCTETATVIINEPPLLTVNMATTIVNCGQNDGSATATPNGGTPAYIYAWSNGGNTATINNLSVGTYTVTVTDQNGCTVVGTATVNNQSGGTVTASVTSNYNGEDVSCNGVCDGTGIANMNGGSSPFTYNWSSGGNTQNETNLCAGTYTVTVTDDLGCTSVDSITLTEPTLVTANITNSVDILCNGGNNGSATVTSGGGTPGYTYAWSSGGTVATENNLTAGNYTVTVSDLNNCTATATVTINEPTALNIATIVSSNYNGEDISCFGRNDGEATTTPNGGTTPYSYNWSSGGNSSVEGNLTAGTYTVTVTDANGCTIVDSVTLSEPTQVTISIDALTEVECHGAATGEITVSSNGGTGVLVYSWNSGHNGSNLTNIIAGTYTVTVTDANGCTATADTIITEPDELIPTITPIGISCQGYCDGVANASAIGGVLPYTYLWSTGNTTTDIIELCVGDYTVTVTDANGCTAVESTILDVLYPDPIPDFSIDPERTTVLDTRIDFYDLSFSNINVWNWTFFDTDGTTILGGNNTQNPTFEYPQDTGLYPIRLEVYNHGGCISDTIKYLYIDGVFSMFVPDAFSPNGDGLNDLFFPKGIGIDNDNFTMFIYDRWGEVIFKSESIDDKWDGTARSKGGTQLVQEGVYIWKIVTRTATFEKSKKEFVGHVTLIK